MDGTGNAYVLYDDDSARGHFAMHAPGAAWTSPQLVPQGGYSQPQMVVNPHGFVTIASYGQNGVFVTQRMSNGR